MKLLQKVVISLYLQCLFFSFSGAKEVKFRKWSEESFDRTSGEDALGCVVATTKIFELTHKGWGDRNSRIIAATSTLIGGAVWEVLDGLGFDLPETCFSPKDLFSDGVVTGVEKRAELEQVISTGAAVSFIYDGFLLKGTYLPISGSKRHILLNLAGVVIGVLDTFWPTPWEYPHRE